jgi:hypothetical protein
LAEEYVFNGMLQEGDQQMAGEGALAAYADSYDVGVAAGDEIRIFVEMQDMQPHIAILDESGKLVDRTISVLEYFAQYDWKAPAAGTYKILITTTYKADQAYRLTLSDLPSGTVQQYTRQ